MVTTITRLKIVTTIFVQTKELVTDREGVEFSPTRLDVTVHRHGNEVKASVQASNPYLSRRPFPLKATYNLLGYRYKPCPKWIEEVLTAPDIRLLPVVVDKT